MFLDKPSKAFTLVELIVVITILAILATIGYASLIGYGLTARDTKRISDLNNITKVIELYKIQTWNYPPVTNPINISFSGSTIWMQGSFWEETRWFARRISEVPIDPLTLNEFAYAKTQLTGEYQVGTIVEKEASLWKTSLFINSQIHAANLLKDFASTLIKWNYNGKFITHKQWNDIYVLGVPTLLVNEISDVTLQQIFANNSFVYQWWIASPATYSGAVISKWNWWFNPANVTGQDHLVFSWSISDMNTWSWKLDFIWNLKDYYVWTDVENSQSYDELKSIDIATKPNTAIEQVNAYISSGVGWLWDDYLILTEVDTSSEVWSSGSWSTGTLCEFDNENFDQCDFN